MSAITEAKRSELKLIVDNMTDGEAEVIYDQVRKFYEETLFHRTKSWDDIMRTIGWRGYGRHGSNFTD